VTSALRATWWRRLVAFKNLAMTLRCRHTLPPGFGNTILIDKQEPLLLRLDAALG
jgi:hypothetical protein